MPVVQQGRAGASKTYALSPDYYAQVRGDLPQSYDVVISLMQSTDALQGSSVSEASCGVRVKPQAAE